ncbi:MAG: hypothetical protein QM535_21890 [Limnohabitans sp.]|nr:hypothetical protein [Limnohabitans sp.]
MKKYSIILIVMFLFENITIAQNYIESDLFINSFFIRNFPDTVKKRHLLSNIFQDVTLFLNQQDAYSKLKDYLTKAEIDSLLIANKEIAKTFFWQPQTKLNVKLITENDASRILQSASITIMKVRKKGFFIKKRDNVAKYPDTSNVIIKTSVPLFFKSNYCLMVYSVSYSQSRGYTCVYLYKKDEFGNWIQEKLLLSRVG